MTRMRQAKAQKEGKSAMIGSLFCIMGEKNAEMDRALADREYKARIVFGGHRIVTLRWV